MLNRKCSQTITKEHHILFWLKETSYRPPPLKTSHTVSDILLKKLIGILPFHALTILDFVYMMFLLAKSISGASLSSIAQLYYLHIKSLISVQLCEKYYL